MPMQSSHITCQQAGPILSRIKPGLAVLHHLMVNDASRDLIVEQVIVGTSKANIEGFRVCS